MLTIDVGNSGIKWGIWQEDQLLVAGEGAYEKMSSMAALSDIFSEATQQSEAWVSCVAGPDVEQLLTDWLKQEWSIEPVFLRTSAELAGVKNMYPEPSEHGTDRWAALLGAKKLYDDPVCIVDVGTAVTVDLMDENGVHRGGRIMPGLDMMQKALLHNTAGVKEIDGDCPGFAITTADAVTSGTQHMLQAALIEVCAAAQERLGDDMKIIITGGTAEIMMPLLSLPDMRHEPHLVLHGLFFASQQ